MPLTEYLFSSSVVQRYHSSIKACNRSSGPRHGGNAKYSRHTRSKGSEDRKFSCNNNVPASQLHSLEAFAHPCDFFGKYKLKRCFNHLSVLPNGSSSLMEVGIILGQDTYELQKAIHNLIRTRSEPVAVLTELG